MFGVGLSGAAAGAVAVKQSAFDGQMTTPSLSPSTSSSVVKRIERPYIKPIRMIKSETDSTGLKLTLYQYQNCPFCCKVRAYLDHHGFSYSVIEVNSIRRSQIKWSQYKKVPILVIENNENRDDFTQMNDSSLIISVLDTFLEDRSVSLDQLLTYYPSLESVDSRGRKVTEYPNKYFIMYGDSKSIPSYRDEERKWRKWTDDTLVHTLSPNIYRTPSESLQAFRYFSEAGDWKQTFNAMERSIIIYIGAAAMFFIGKMLKKRYSLNDDVRLSMYEACNEWTAAIAKKKTQFMGGSSPNLADLAVYGVINSIEGCTAFQDLKEHTKIADWYLATKRAVQQNAGHPV